MSNSDLTTVYITQLEERMAQLAKQVVLEQSKVLVYEEKLKILEKEHTDLKNIHTEEVGGLQDDLNTVKKELLKAERTTKRQK